MVMRVKVKDCESKTQLIPEFNTYKYQPINRIKKIIWKIYLLFTEEAPMCRTSTNLIKFNRNELKNRMNPIGV